MSSSKTLTPPLDEGSPQLKFYRMERPTGQLFELKEMQKQQLTGLDEADEVPPPPGPPPMAPPPPPPPFESAERGLREFNYNGRDIKPRNSERSSGALGRHRVSSYSIYSDYSSHPSSDDGRRGDDGGRRDAVNTGGGGRDGGSVPQAQRVEHPPPRNLSMRAAPPAHSRSTSGTSRISGQGGGVVVSQPPPTYAPSRELYNRVRFAEQERIRREESRAPGPRRIEMVDVVGGPSVGAMWVFACCYFFWYRCLMDGEDF